MPDTIPLRPRLAKTSLRSVGAKQSLRSGSAKRSLRSVGAKRSLRSGGTKRSLRSGRFDDLGLRRALGDRMLPLLVAAMAFLAALALAGAVGAAALARHWQEGAGAAMTVQVPATSGPSPVDRVVTILLKTPGIASARALSAQELADLLRPWLGGGAPTALPLPAVIAVRTSGAGPELAALTAQLDAVAPGTLVESHGVWLRRLTVLARSLQACAWAVLLVVALVAAAVIAVATRAGLAARREAIDIVHGLGATDSYIAARFAGRATRLAALGGIIGALAALPALLGLAVLAAPFATAAAPVPAGEVPAWLAALPAVLWLALPCLPLGAALIGYTTAQGTVRSWLRRLP
jgi:cell division transport system permease protein